MELSKEYYHLLVTSGMFWVRWPECTGNYEHDKPIIEEWFTKRGINTPFKGF